MQNDDQQPFNPFGDQQGASSPPPPPVQPTAPAPTPTPVAPPPTQPDFGNDYTPEPKPRRFDRKTLLLILMGLAVILVIAAIVVSSLPKGDTSDQGTDTGAPGSTIAQLSDFTAVCEGEKIEAAAAVQNRDYKVAPFISYFNVWAAYTASDSLKERVSTDLSKINVVGCIDPDTGTVANGKTCDVKNVQTNQIKQIQYASVTYVARFYEAKTGTKLAESRVAVPNDGCPATALPTTTILYPYPTEAQLAPAFDALLKA